MTSKESIGEQHFPFGMEQPDSSLADISEVKVDPALPVDERLEAYLKQIKNPYRYKDSGFTVTCAFTGERSLEECMAEYLCEKYGIQKRL
ncbi:DUF6870 family protein [Lacrimispora indolis]|uniref:DUF6870 family protein n=1 Tax=Lacrimispora indolis TaxID=69825 RepID=UPI0003FEF437|nr:hypothetical protein [[Clostridium] methoxybenzovorans]